MCVVSAIGRQKARSSLARKTYVDAAPDQRGISFDTTIKRALFSGDVGTLVNYSCLGEPALYSVPTTDHYLPLLYAAGLREEGESLSFICEMYQNRSVSMGTFMIGG